MDLSSLMALLLIGHVLGDFYFQSNEMAVGKVSKNIMEKRKWMTVHGVAYAACMAVVLFAGTELSLEVLWAFLTVALIHILIDIFKYHITWKPFVVDQFLHILTLAVASLIFSRYIGVKGFMAENHHYLLMVLGLLVVVRPIGLLIESRDIWQLEESENLEQGERMRNTSRMIGYLERIIVFFLLLLGQYSAIALVIAAKSIARFPEIKDDEGRLKADYYIIGTMLSLACVLLIAATLGLM